MSDIQDLIDRVKDNSHLDLLVNDEREFLLASPGAMGTVQVTPVTKLGYKNGDLIKLLSLGILQSKEVITLVELNDVPVRRVIVKKAEPLDVDEVFNSLARDRESGELTESIRKLKLDGLETNLKNIKIASKALPVAFNILEKWKCSPEEQVMLLGFRDAEEMRRAKKDSDNYLLSNDAIERMSYVFNIYRIFKTASPNQDFGLNWLRAPQAELGDQTPLQHAQTKHGLKEVKCLAEVNITWW